MFALWFFAWTSACLQAYSELWEKSVGNKIVQMVFIFISFLFDGQHPRHEA
jgi:hypothetical protein